MYFLADLATRCMCVLMHWI